MPPTPRVGRNFPSFSHSTSASNFHHFSTPSKPPKAAQNRPKSFQKPPQDPPKTTSKPHLILQCPKSQKNTTLPYETLIFDVPRPSKIAPKSKPKRLHNRLSLGCPLGAPKNPNLDAKTSPRSTPKISLFSQNSFKKFKLFQSLVHDAS